MTIDQLKAQQEKELSDYWQLRATRSENLENSQRDMLDNFSATTEKGKVMLKNILLEQREQWEQDEQDELDLIRHAHTMQKEDWEKESVQKIALMHLLQDRYATDNTRGR